MELVIDYQGESFLEGLAGKVVYVMLMPPFHQEDINAVKRLGMKPILNFYQLLNSKQLEEISKEILKYQHEDCLFYITDLGLAYRLKRLGLSNRLIFDPTTMITNTLDAKEYASEGFKAVGISNEIPLKDAIKIASAVPSFYQLFGYRLMFYSARRLISLFGEQNNQQFSNGAYEIKEETRKDHFPVVQNDHGTMIYRGYLINLLPHLKEIPSSFGYLSSFGLKPATYERVVQAFIEEDHTIIEGLSLPIEEGFTYQDSVYQKEDF